MNVKFNKRQIKKEKFSHNGRRGQNALKHAATDKCFEVGHVLALAVRNIMKTNVEVVIFKTVFVVGQVGVDALLLVDRALKRVQERV